jgi:hypothetical protein
MQHPKSEVWPYKKVLPEHVPVLIERYQNGESARKICLDMPFAEDVALKVLRDFDIPIKTRKENRFSMGFTINENAFSDVNEPECAYFYGWLLTDGCLRKTKYAHSVSMGLKLDDREILDSLEMYLHLNERVKTRSRFYKATGKTYHQAEIQFQYAPITERLISFGLTERKSTKEVCPKEFLFNRDFWRGVLEGDGYLSKLGSCTKMQICGSETLCNQWFDYCKSVVPDMSMTITADPRGNGLFHTYSGRFAQCKAVLDSLYLGVPKHLRLERKYNLYVGRYYDGIDPNRTS